MRTLLTRTLAVLLLLLPLRAWTTPKSAYTWNQLEDGLLYTTFSFTTGDNLHTTLHAFQIDPKKFRIGILVADPTEKEGTTVDLLAKRHGALIVINGGYFSSDHTSIGLLIQNGKMISKPHPTSWWSIFSLEGTTPRISKLTEYHPSVGTRMALQAGPRLIIDGVIPSLKEGTALRSGIGITLDGRIILVATEGAGITLQEFAERFSYSRWKGGLECTNALNLDGGGSTQLFAKTKTLSLSISGRSHIANSIAVFPK